MRRQTIKIGLVWVILITMLASGFSFAASPNETTISEGKANGELMGTLDGDLAGRTDRNANKVSNYLTAMPKDTEIVSRYQLNKDQSLYQNEFLKAYRDAFQIAYHTGYRTVNVEEYASPFENAYAHGEAAGTVQGEMSAMIDFTQDNNNSWLSAYNDYLSDGSLTLRYQLDREPVAYRNYFASGYREAFRKAYIETFQVKNLETEVRNKNARMVTMLEDTVYFDEELVHFNMGTMEAEMRTPMSLYFPSAAIYEPTYFGVFKTQNTFNYRNYNAAFTPVSGKYTVAVLSDRGATTLKRPITLSFEYQGSERAGIYQWIGNKWVYQYTTLTDGAILTTIPAGYYSGGEYAIFIDETYKHVSDITFNWAYKEIYTLMRRDVISDGAAFNPNSKITRGTFALMVFNAISGTDPLKTSTKVINDFDSLKWYQDAAKYMVNKGYMKLDAKGNFNASGEVSYADAEHMLSVMFTRNVKWTEVSNKMMTEKFVRSVGATNTSASMTKAEAAYMLTVFYK